MDLCTTQQKNLQGVQQREKNSVLWWKECDMRHVYVLVHGCVCASHADKMKNGGRLKYMGLQNANPNNKEGLHVFQPSCAACL